MGVVVQFYMTTYSISRILQKGVIFALILKYLFDIFLKECIKLLIEKYYLRVENKNTDPYKDISPFCSILKSSFYIPFDKLSPIKIHLKFL